MEKEKLRRVRKQKGYTQQEIADIIATDVSNYSRKESGAVKITKIEWEKMSKFFDVPMEEIYEEEEVSVIIHNENTTVNDNGAFYNVNGTSNNYNIPNSVIDNLQKYIAMLEEEIKRLKAGKK
ncbi:helix-turn-helix domain-containing protein [Chryseobacterium vrystaatense]|uniref:DNA-binding transcriptional regulator, XRE-family HTH domain n=1 Tax=Chryseobacterium vrystaatense TaxID=307480 RepID=A0A1M4W482_9FLAO|nr:helix-turn-helix transcriptional regulator [Chryseobacterium vrystaatense]SHE76071.1 DNA-binding transcriptional regulator, XRE-family HTH domain [Chryseobacterium vrystaatense]